MLRIYQYFYLDMMKELIYSFIEVLYINAEKFFVGRLVHCYS